MSLIVSPAQGLFHLPGLALPGQMKVDVGAKRVLQDVAVQITRGGAHTAHNTLTEL